MKCLICNENSEKSICDDCSNKKRCKDRNIMKTDYQSYKNGKMYSTCIEYFNKKLMCEYCNREFNKLFFSKHIARCLIRRCLITNDDKKFYKKQYWWNL